MWLSVVVGNLENLPLSSWRCGSAGRNFYPVEIQPNVFLKSDPHGLWFCWIGSCCTPLYWLTRGKFYGRVWVNHAYTRLGCLILVRDKINNVKKIFFIGFGQNSTHSLLDDRWLARSVITWISCVLNARVHRVSRNASVRKRNLRAWRSIRDDFGVLIETFIFTMGRGWNY